MNLSAQLKLLANGINPETGEVLERESLVHKPEAIRMLFALAEELLVDEKPKTKKPKLTLDERREKNIEEGRLPKSHFPWEEEEKAKLANDFKSLADIGALSSRFERSPLAIAVQLQRMELLSEEVVELYRQQHH